MNYRRLRDAKYLTRQPVTAVQEHQVAGLMPAIRAMVQHANSSPDGGLAAPEVGVNLNFFVAKNPDPRDRDCDVVFHPFVSPVFEQVEDENGVLQEIAPTVTVEEYGVDGKRYRVVRYKKVHMRWLYHNGTSFEEREGVFTGDVAYLAQTLTDRLGGVYLGPDSQAAEVVLG
jgi:peptide deformylase